MRLSSGKALMADLGSSKAKTKNGSGENTKKVRMEGPNGMGQR